MSKHPWSCRRCLVPLLLGLLVCSCGSGDPVHIAVVVPQSGPRAGEGLELLRGVELALETWGDREGIRARDVVLDVYDDADDPALARRRAQEIVDTGRALAVIGHLSSDCSLAAGEVYREHGIPAITPTATEDRLTRDNEWYFSSIFDNDHQARLLAHYVHRLLPGRAVFVVHETAPFGAGLAKTFEQTSRALGIEILGSRSFDPKAVDLDATYTEIVNEVASLESTLVLLSVHPRQGVELVRRIRDSGSRAPLLGPHSLSSPIFPRLFEGGDRSASHYTEGIYVAAPLLLDSAEPEAAALLLRYRLKYGQASGWQPAFSHDAAVLLLHALQASAGEARPVAVALRRRRLRDTLAGMTHRARSVADTAGPGYFTRHGSSPAPVYIGVYADNQLISATTHFRPLHAPGRPVGGIDHLDPARLIHIDDEVFVETPLVYVGLDFHNISELDADAGSWRLDATLWFRSRIDLDVTDLVFPDVLEEVELTGPVTSVLRDDVYFRTYRLRGRFRMDVVPPAYGQHNLGLRFRHQRLTRDELAFALDITGMGFHDKTLAENQAVLNRIVDPAAGYRIVGGNSFQDVVTRPTGGHPDHPLGATLEFSSFNLMLNAAPDRISPRGTIAHRLGRTILLLSGALLLGLPLATRLFGFGRHARSLWLMHAVAAVFFLLAAESFVGGWFAREAAPHGRQLVTKAFDTLWWLVPAILVISALERFIWLPLERQTGQTVPSLVRRAAAVVIVLLACFGIVAFVFERRLTSLLATSGLVAAIIGLALQVNLANIFSGIAVNLERPFRIGDWIMVHGHSPNPETNIIGCVEDINWRTTRLRTTENAIVVIPNAVISEKTVTNFMFPDERSRFELDFIIDLSVPHERAIKVLLEGATAVVSEQGQGIMADPPPKVRVTRTSELGVHYRVHYWIVPRHTGPAKARHLVNTSVLTYLHEAGITPVSLRPGEWSASRRPNESA